MGELKSLDKIRTMKALGAVHPELADMLLTLEGEMLGLVDKNSALKAKLLAAESIPTAEQIARWEAIAKAKILVLREIAEVLCSECGASSGYLRQKCGLSADEWHGAGELIAAVTVFAAEKGFIDWHTEGMQ